MTDPGPSPSPEPAAEASTLASRLAVKQRAGGIAVPIATVLLAFFMGGVVVAATQHSVHKGLIAYRDIFKGAGLNWIFHPTTNLLDITAYNLSQTLLQTSTLILTGLAVAFAFRCGMFNIGGQGQYFMGLFVANWIGVSLVGVNSLAAGHLTLVPALRAELAELGRSDIMIVVGGVIPPQDFDALRDAGASAIFPPGTVIADAAVDLLRELAGRHGH